MTMPFIPRDFLQTQKKSIELISSPIYMALFSLLEKPIAIKQCFPKLMVREQKGLITNYGGALF